MLNFTGHQQITKIDSVLFFMYQLAKNKNILYWQEYEAKASFTVNIDKLKKLTVQQQRACAILKLQYDIPIQRIYATA